MCAPIESRSRLLGEWSLVARLLRSPFSSPSTHDWSRRGALLLSLEARVSPLPAIVCCSLSPLWHFSDRSLSASSRSTNNWTGFSWSVEAWSGWTICLNLNVAFRSTVARPRTTVSPNCSVSSRGEWKVVKRGSVSLARSSNSQQLPRLDAVVRCKLRLLLASNRDLVSATRAAQQHSRQHVSARRAEIQIGSETSDRLMMELGKWSSGECFDTTRVSRARTARSSSNGVLVAAAAGACCYAALGS